jgi:hypothetical protein
MGRKEKEIINKEIMKANKTGRLFRANSGRAWIGETGCRKPGKLLLINPRVFHGMPKGTPDLIGWEIQEISKPCCGSCKNLECCNLVHDKLNPYYKTKGLIFIYEILKNNICAIYEPNNIKKIAVFKGVEVKTGNKRLTKEQRNFKKILLEHGGIHEIARE